MAEIAGWFEFQGIPRNNVTATLYPRSVFASRPSKGTALPVSGAITTATTGTSHGGDGHYRFTSVPPGLYYIGFSYAGTVAWENAAAGPTTAKDYGAAGDGTTNDTTALQAALDDTAIKELFIPAGTYLVTGLTCNRAITIRGEGPRTILTAAAPGADQVILALTTASGIVVRDLAIHGQMTAGGGFTQTGVKVSSSAHEADILGCYFSGTAANKGLTTQIHLQGVNECHIKNCRFKRVIGTTSNYGYGILNESSSYSQVMFNHGTQSATQGRHHWYGSVASSYCQVKHNTFVGGTQSQITMAAATADGGCLHNQLCDNILVDMVSGTVDVGCIHLTENCAFNTIRRNQIVRPKYHGIVIEASPNAASSRCDDNDVSENYIYFADQIGIRLLGCNRATVKGNRVHESSQTSAGVHSGVQEKSNTANAQCSDNEISGNYLYGPTNQRAPITIDSTAPLPLRTIVRENYMPDGQARAFTNFGQSTKVDEDDWLMTTVAYSDLAAAATTNNITLFSLPAGYLVEKVILKHSTAFSGGAISAYTVSVGIAGTLNKYAAAFDVFQAVGATVFQLSTTQGVESMGAAVDLKIAATSTGANLNAATAGSVDVFVRISRVGHRVAA